MPRWRTVLRPAVLLLALGVTCGVSAALVTAPQAQAAPAAQIATYTSKEVPTYIARDLSASPTAARPAFTSTARPVATSTPRPAATARPVEPMATARPVLPVATARPVEPVVPGVPVSPAGPGIPIAPAPSTPGIPQSLDPGAPPAPALAPSLEVTYHEGVAGLAAEYNVVGQGLTSVAGSFVTLELTGPDGVVLLTRSSSVTVNGSLRATIGSCPQETGCLPAGQYALRVLTADGVDAGVPPAAFVVGDLPYAAPPAPALPEVVTMADLAGEWWSTSQYSGMRITINPDGTYTYPLAPDRGGSVVLDGTSVTFPDGTLDFWNGGTGQLTQPGIIEFYWQDSVGYVYWEVLKKVG